MAKKHCDVPQEEVSEERFWRKVARFAKRAGKEVLEKALILFYVSRSEHLPLRVKAMVFGALAYFVSTLDAIPDITPVVGFADDLGVLAAVIGVLARWISPDIQDKVDTKLREYFATEQREPSQAAKDKEFER